MAVVTSWDGNTFHITGAFFKEPTGHRWIPFTQRASNVFFAVSLNKLLETVGDLGRLNAYVKSLYHSRQNIIFHKYVAARLLHQGRGNA